jgi:hypothetical protein
VSNGAAPAFVADTAAVLDDAAVAREDVGAVQQPTVEVADLEALLAERDACGVSAGRSVIAEDAHRVCFWIMLSAGVVSHGGERALWGLCIGSTSQALYGDVLVLERTRTSLQVGFIASLKNLKSHTIVQQVCFKAWDLKWA